MYHFVSEKTPELRLSDNVVITSQYLKSFQIEAIQFLYSHLTKQEFCILNDESGLGKSAVIATLLSALGPNKKTLIVLQNDDQLLVGWQFHLNVLTDLPVYVIQNANDSTESPHSIYLAKWSILRSIGDLSKLNFDYVIVDHRGHTLNNTFCTSMLLKQFERNVNIVISSVDVTSDVKLLYNVLRIGGRLEEKFKSLKSFEHKFHLPDAKEVFSKKMDLEEYYKQRGILGDYVKDFRLRRYRHQFDHYLPLVNPEEYRRNLTLWLSTCQNSSTTISDITIESSAEARSTAGTDDILECLMNLKRDRERERELADREGSEKFSEHSNEVIAMSPLIFEMSETESEGTPTHPEGFNGACLPIKSTSDAIMLSSDDCEIVTPPKTPSPKKQGITAQKSPQKTKRRFSKRLEEPKELELSESDSEIFITPMRKSRSAENTPVMCKARKLNVRLTRVTLEAPKKPLDTLLLDTPTKAVVSSIDAKAVIQTPKRNRREMESCPKGIHLRETRSMQRLTRSAEPRLRNKYMTLNVAMNIDRKPAKRRSRQDGTQTPRTSKKDNETKSPVEEETPKAPRRGRKATKQVDNKPTATSKDKKSPKEAKKKESPNAQTEKESSPPPETSRKNRNQVEIIQVKGSEPKKRGRKPKSEVAKVKKGPKDSNKKADAPSEPLKVLSPPPEPQLTTQPLISSGSTISESNFLQCAQKLPTTFTELQSLEDEPFRIPIVPQQTTPSLFLSSQLNIISDSEVCVVPSLNPREVVVISSSHDESSEPSSTQSRRTRALKRKRKPQPVVVNSPTDRPGTSSSFGVLLAQQRSQNKSPDIFSNCTDFSHLAMAQEAPTSPFEGFKIFGSEVKQIQQQHAQNQLPKKKRERSCLDLLEQMFDPRPSTQTTSKSAEKVMPTFPPILPEPASNAPITQRRRTLLEDDIFEITNNGEFGSRLRLNSTGDVSPVHHQQSQMRCSQSNKITNYLIGSNNTQEEEQQPSANRMRKSPKGIKSNQTTKLTRWFATTPASSGEPLCAPNTSNQPTKSLANQADRNVRGGGPTKRKRLELFK